MLERKAEDSQLPYCAQHGMAFSPLTVGAGPADGHDRSRARIGAGDMRARSPRFQKAFLRKLDALLERLPLAAARGITLAQLVIAWTFHQRGCTHVLAGARSPAHAAENAAAGVIELTPDESQSSLRRWRPTRRSCDGGALG